jgi:hypothetical protein
MRPSGCAFETIRVATTTHRGFGTRPLSGRGYVKVKLCSAEHNAAGGSLVTSGNRPESGRVRLPSSEITMTLGSHSAVIRRT